LSVCFYVYQGVLHSELKSLKGKKRRILTSVFSGLYKKRGCCCFSSTFTKLEERRRKRDRGGATDERRCENIKPTDAVSASLERALMAGGGMSISLFLFPSSDGSPPSSACSTAPRLAALSARRQDGCRCALSLACTCAASRSSTPAPLRVRSALLLCSSGAQG